jgi:hypothetical protein
MLNCTLSLSREDLPSPTGTLATRCHQVASWYLLTDPAPTVCTRKPPSHPLCSLGTGSSAQQLLFCQLPLHAADSNWDSLGKHQTPAKSMQPACCLSTSVRNGNARTRPPAHSQLLWHCLAVCLYPPPVIFLLLLQGPPSGSLIQASAYSSHS